MRIDSYAIGMESDRLYKSKSGIRKYVSRGESNPSTGSPLSSFTNTLQNSEANEEGAAKEDIKTDKDKVLENAMYKLSARSPLVAPTVIRRNSVSDEFQKLHQMMLRRIFDMLFGSRSSKHPEEAEGPELFPVQTVAQYEYTESYMYEREDVSFDATGIVKTSDGREISINVNLSMSREFTSYYTECTGKELVAFCDPLVINFDAPTASLSDMKFRFDIDSDGTLDDISYLKSGSGYLALDLNNDGAINDGSELFGTASGNGFADLAKYDSDKNGWIDENDEIFDKLKIWVKDSEGNDILYRLKDKNVGAIYLGSTDTEFSLNSNLDNSSNGLIRKTGLFLYESGMAGTVQHLDLATV